MHLFLPLFLVFIGAAASAAQISVRTLQSGNYEFVLTNSTALSEGEARTQIVKAAATVCKGAKATPGKWKYESNEAIGGGAASSPKSNTFRFVQEISCVPIEQVASSESRPTLINAEESRRVQSEVKLKSEAYFTLIASKRIDEALTHVAVTRMGLNEVKWKSDKLSFQAMSGEPVQISLAKVTVYDNPAGAPEPGLYVAADYSNTYRDMPIHCGYLMWFRPIGGEFRITREESGYVTAEQLKSIPSDQLPEVKRKLRCPAP